MAEGIAEYVTDSAKRLATALGSERASEMTETLRHLGEDLAEEVREHPLQAIASAVTLGYVLVKLVQAPGSMVPRIIGKGIGSMVAARFLDRLAPGVGTSGESAVRH